MSAVAVRAMFRSHPEKPAHSSHEPLHPTRASTAWKPARPAPTPACPSATCPIWSRASASTSIAPRCATPPAISWRAPTRPATASFSRRNWRTASRSAAPARKNAAATAQCTSIAPSAPRPARPARKHATSCSRRCGCRLAGVARIPAELDRSNSCRRPGSGTPGRQAGSNRIFHPALAPKKPLAEEEVNRKIMKMRRRAQPAG